MFHTKIDGRYERIRFDRAGRDIMPSSDRESFRVSPKKAAPPKVLHIVPIGSTINSRDGRSFKLSDPARVIAASRTPGLIDWEHRSESSAFGSEAAGWIGAFRYDPKLGIVAEVESWTPKGAEDVLTYAFRFLSPVLTLDPKTRDVQAIESVALTNIPALRLAPIGG